LNSGDVKVAADPPSEPGKSLVPQSDNLTRPASVDHSTAASIGLSDVAQLASTTNQSGAIAGHDIVGRDKHTAIFNYNAPALQPKIVAELMDKLRHEIDTNQTIRDTIDNLRLFYLRKSDDGVVGLEPKLIKGGRESETLFALEKKEQFAKLLERWSLYASAQEIFAYLLAKAEHKFSTEVRPKIKTISGEDIDKLVTSTIIEPLIDECGVGVFNLNHSIAMGMLYWLAEMCFVRWH
jgi:hypothetical protein